MTIATNLRFVPFSMVVDKDALTRRLCQITVGNKRIATDFPMVKTRYGSLEAAARSVQQNIDGERSDSVAFAIMTQHNHVLGVASLRHYALYGAWSLLGWRPKFVEGPQLACWIEPRHVRPEGYQRALLPEILMEFDRQVQSRKVSGMPWTLVRPSHQHCVTAIEATPAFGGLFERFAPATYWRVDRSWRKRQLYVGRRM